jgi:lipopolysaccharide/colanic/teichoic acid biosynthesis glycosyltransferase
LISKEQLFVKRIFDVVLAIAVLPIVLVPMFIFILLASIDTKTFGVFQQERIGQYGKTFMMYKVRTLRIEKHVLGRLDESASAFGRWLRRHKLDELPQLFNVVLGQMSFVGPRPDIKGYADLLEGKSRIILKVKPGITGPATLKYKYEEQLLAQQPDPEWYNDHVIWPDKVRINSSYIKDWGFWKDVEWLIKSV